MTSNITDDSFDKEVLQSTDPVLVDFWAEWCGPCKMLTHILEELSKELVGKVKIVKMDIEQNPNIPSSLGIRAIPTMILFKDGKQLATKTGLFPKNSIEEWIDSSIKM
ncbi:thioredoxin [Candidatus Tisiphia endosymbiont of Ptychoptera albimana]|uniref:thioredoxin n=1 Tax=Candidatus Tisiphia endosymbiont of Ptychoptera albimana TaxID=3066260 RepID=UPI001D3225D5|nr:thioredoxin [Rickettsia endosymbiont of Sericostoma sp. HW-2014]